MFQIDTATAVATRPAATAAGTPAWFTDGNPGSGIPATILPAEFMNMLMAELLGVLSAGSITPDKTASNQVTLAIQAMISGAAVGVQSGSVIYVAKSTAPTGYLKANGAAVSRTTYAALFAAIGTVFGVGDGSTTFNLPDLRGEFLRGWDDSRGVDSGRTLGSAQSADIAPHSHPYDYSAIQAGATVGGNNNIPQAANTGGGTFATRNSSGSETRPRNIALLACIKY